MSAVKRFALPLAAGWVLLAAAWYFTRPLGAGAVRLDLLLTLDDAFFPAVDPAIRTGFVYLPQRFPAWGIAAAVWAGACGWGVMLLRSGGVPPPRRSPGSEPNRSLRRNRKRWCGTVETWAFAAGLGMATLWTLAFLLGAAGWLNGWTAWGLVLVGCAGFVVDVSPTRKRGRNAPAPHTGSGAIDATPASLARRAHDLWPLLATLPFLALLPPAATLPATDFDVKEYHLEAAKEFFIAGRVTHLPHNVYTDFPLGTETVLLLGMTLAGDWRAGALAGQATLAGFVPLAGLATYCAGRRLFGSAAGVWAAVIFLTSPWAVRFAAHPLAEGGLTAFLALTLLAGTIAVRRRRSPSVRPAVLLGLCAGAAFACKYPAAVQAVIPAGLAVAAGWRTGGRATGKKLAAFAAATLVFAGPWLVRNLLNTGNPVFPLLWSVFGGEGWDAATDARWRAVHGPPEFAPSRLPHWFAGPLGADLHHTVLVPAFVPLAFLHRRTRRVGWVFGLTAGLLVAWYALTHRIDRFWAPLLPALAVLAGAGATWCFPPRAAGLNPAAPRARADAWRWVRGGLLAVAAAYNLAAAVTFAVPLPPTADLSDATAVAVETTAPLIDTLNDRPGPNAVVLLVGEAQVFDGRFTPRYRTTWDGSPLPDLAAVPPDEARAWLADRGVTHVAVNWGEVLRYRRTYGFDERVTGSAFDRLVAGGVLGAGEIVAGRPASDLSASERAEVRAFAPDRLVRRGGEDWFVTAELFEVPPLSRRR